MKIINHLFLISIVTILSSQSIALADRSIQVTSSTINDNNGEYIRTRFLKLMKKPFINSSDKTKQQKKILIIGDSHAQDFLNAIAENHLLSKSQIRTRYIPTRCQIYLGDNKKRRWESNDTQLCEKSDNLESAKAQIINADVIILVALWRKWSAESLPETIKNLQLNSDQTLFVIGRRSFRKVENKRIQNLSDSELRQLRIEVDKDQIEINKIMNSTLNKNSFIDVHSLICGQGSTCPAFTDNLKMISFDGGHLSPDGAHYIGRELFNKTQLKHLIKNPVKN